MGVINHKFCAVCSSDKIKEKSVIKDFSHTKEEFSVYECADCGFYFTQNIPDEYSIGLYYKSENYVSHSDTQKGLFFKLYHAVRSFMLKKKRDLVVQYTGLPKGKLLDIGAGTGYFLDVMNKSGWETHGVEQDDETRAYAIKKSSSEVCSAKEFYDLPEDTFNAVTMWHVLEHVHDLKGYLNKIHKVLKEDGVLIVAVPNHKSYDADYYQEYWAAWDIPIHLWHFTPKTIRGLMQRNGFIVMDNIPMPFDAAYVSMLSEQYKSGSKWSGLLRGLKFALKGRKNPDKCSSVIYIIKKR